MNKIQVWGISKEGEGFVQDLGVYEEMEQIIIRVGMFSDDMIITFEDYIEKNYE